jgi:hypothetical protein
MSSFRPASPARWARRIAVASAIGALAALPAFAQAPSTLMPVVNGTVNDQVLSGNTLYLGGSFTMVAPQTGAAVPIDSATATVPPGFPPVAGLVTAVTTDGRGGWFIGGTFSTVGGVPRANLAHIRSDFSLAPWNPGTDGQVLALAFQSGVLYAGGAFTTVGGVGRARIAAIDTATGVPTGWNPSSNDLVRALVARPGVIYAGGRFVTIGAASRNRIAALDATTGLATAWNPSASLDVYGLAEAGGLVYAGGTFTNIGGATRNRIAALDETTGLATSWNPNAGNQVTSISVGGGVVYLGGAFVTMGGQPRQRLAAVDGSTGALLPFNPGASATVWSMSLVNSTLYVGGDFTTLAGVSRSRIGALDATTGVASSWDPEAANTVSAVFAAGDGSVFIGGSFGGVGGAPRNNLAAIDLPTGTVLPWNPDVGGQVLALRKRAGILYVGGQFTTVSGQARQNLAAVDAVTGALRPWNPGTDGQVTAIAANDTVVYVGGLFSVAGGAGRSAIAQLSAATGTATAWNASADDQVFVLQDGGSVIYAGGSFTFIGGQSRSFLAALDPVTGAATAWDPEPNGTIRSMFSTCGTVYVGGFFTMVGSNLRNRLAAIDGGTGAALGWNPNVNGPIFDIELSDGLVYVGGVFNVIGSTTRNRVAALNPLTGVATSWNPDCNSTVRTISAGAGQVAIAGTFTVLGGAAISNVGSVPADGSSTCPLITLSPATPADGYVGTPYSLTLSASGGVAPYCWSVTTGTLPPGLFLTSGGVIAGTPTTSGSAAFVLTATDARGCQGTLTTSLTVFGAPAASTIFASTSGLCVNPAHPSVSVPFVFARAEAAPVRLVSVTFQLQSPLLSLNTPLTPSASVHLGSFFDPYPSSIAEVTDNGGGSYTVDATILGQPCGQTTGGTVLRVDVTSSGPDGLGSVTVTSVRVRECDNSPVAVDPGPAASLKVQFTPLAIAPATLPSGMTGASYHQVLVASLGTAPYVFGLTSGTLPPGVTLTPDGIVDGVPTSGGSYPITVGVTDAFGCAGTRDYTLLVDCVPLAVNAALAPDGLLGASYLAGFTATGGSGAITWSVGSGELPDGLTLTPSSGQLAGTPATPGTFTFSLTATDAYGCSASRGFAISIFTTPITTTVATAGSGLCVSNGHLRVGVPIVLTRTDATPLRHVQVLFRPDPLALMLSTPATPDSSVHAGSLFAGFPTPTVTVSAGPSGTWLAELDLPGEPCGPTGPGTLLTADVSSTGPDGPASVEVLAVRLVGCAGDTLPSLPEVSTPLEVNHSAPPAIAALSATQVLTGNGGAGTTAITVSWTPPGTGTVELYRAPWASYPAYASATPPDSSLIPAAPWTLVSANATPPYTDTPGVRGSWYYVVRAVDDCGNPSAPSPTNGGTLDYLLGDVSNGVATGAGDNSVGLEDVTLLGANYGISGATLASRGVQYLDVGPTFDTTPFSRPVPDANLDFEDLMILTANFGASLQSPRTSAVPATTLADDAAPEQFRLDGPSFVNAGDDVVATLHLSGSGRLHGFSVRLAWNPLVLEPVSVRSAGFVEARGGVALSPGPGRLDGAVLGRDAAGLAGEGDVATFHFRARRTGDAGLRLAQVLGRDGHNRPLGDGALAQAAELAAPHETVLLAPAPNPFARTLAVTFSLAVAGNAEVSVFDINGRRVRTLASGPHAAGVHHADWDGLDESRSPVAQGVYYLRFTAGDRRQVSRVVHLK